MTTTRKLIKTFEDNAIQLTKLEPSKSLLICSMPCERQTAEIRNSTVDNMINEDIAMVAYRYLQAMRGERNTFNEAVCWAACVVISLVYIYLKITTVNFQDELSSEPSENFDNQTNFIFQWLIVLMYAVANAIPNVANTLKYGETKNACDVWLQARLEDDMYNKLKQLPNNYDSLFKIDKLLKEKNIDTTNLEKKFNKF